MRTSKGFHARSRTGHGRNGTALVAGLVTVVGLMGMSVAVLTIALSSADERLSAVDDSKALLIANSGIAHALANLTAGDQEPIGYSQAPLGFSDGGYFVSVAPNGDGSFTVTSTGAVRGHRRAAQAIIAPEGGGIFENAIFAGNSSGDPLYELELGGSGGSADEVLGDVYSGGGVSVDGDAEVDGTVRAMGTIAGTDGVEGVGRNIPDLFAMNYEATADFNVYDLFAAEAWYGYDNAGGNAWQVPESNPAHVFRANPSDRSSEYGSTPKVDFFLEDPYEAVKSDTMEDGSDAYNVSFSGVNGEPGQNGDNRVYFIDGNLWLHNYNTLSLIIESAPGGTQVTFVVKGNIYFSDNLFYGDEEADGVSFIAMKDENYADSGNIYFGDPEFGTLRRMHGFMYAENDFYDINLDASGSSVVEVYGNMTAGNQVVIERDYVDSWGKVKHTKLLVDFDERVRNGTLSLPGLPGQESSPGEAVYRVVSWRKVSVALAEALAAAGQEGKPAHDVDGPNVDGPGVAGGGGYY